MKEQKTINVLFTITAFLFMALASCSGQPTTAVKKTVLDEAKELLLSYQQKLPSDSMLLGLNADSHLLS
jgi:hypothetical protein